VVLVEQITEVAKRRIQVIGRSHTVRDASTTNTVLFIKWRFLHEAPYDKVFAYLHQGADAPPQSPHHAAFSQPQTSNMDTKSRRSKYQDVTLSTLNAAIEAMNLAKEVSSITPAKAIFGSVSLILTMIKVGPLLVHLHEP
jgi:hypothetical protein